MKLDLKKLLLLLLAVVCMACPTKTNQKKYKDSSLAIEDRIDDLLARMASWFWNALLDFY